MPADEHVEGALAGGERRLDVLLLARVEAPPRVRAALRRQTLFTDENAFPDHNSNISDGKRAVRT